MELLINQEWLKKLKQALGLIPEVTVLVTESDESHCWWQYNRAGSCFFVLNNLSARLNSVQILQLFLILELITGKYPEIMDKLEVRCILQLELHKDLWSSQLVWFFFYVR